MALPLEREHWNTHAQAGSPAGNGHSMQEEARLILREAVGRAAEPENLAAFIHECFAPYGGVELELPPRGPMRELPRLD